MAKLCRKKIHAGGQVKHRCPSRSHGPPGNLYPIHYFRWHCHSGEWERKNNGRRGLNIRMSRFRIKDPLYYETNKYSFINTINVNNGYIV